MLILTRKVGEAIRIGEVVTVRVLEVRGGQVRLGVDAPTDVRIFREEIYQARDTEPAGETAEARPRTDGVLRGKPPTN